MNLLPKRLKKEPLIEAIWQVQFEVMQDVGDVLIGILFSELKKTHPILQWRRLPSADIPALVARGDPNLQFAPKMLIEEPNGSFIWQVGDRVITLNCRKPYVGWCKFKEAVKILTQIIESSELISNPQRHSLRYIDLLRDELAMDLTPLRLKLQLGDYQIKDRVQIRLEIPDAECIHILQIATKAHANIKGERIIGSIIDLETLPATKPGNWDALRAQLDLLHDHSKEFFFREILTKETVQKLNPEY
ncbi:TIGR04255 family protein [Methylacidiphilum caldifontis]|uniref:TIGR04255 family protein n=1 Tax=Methylacidiphilum caldifontis TaxID=2795386 RepID=UPI001A8F8537|nr:TIGR04255 family protein [Methylacidiphilum caldifontis]QSR89278.1 TIGR04255 family protein [Methylacidiphilum caldifontis]